MKHIVKFFEKAIQMKNKVNGFVLFLFFKNKGCNLSYIKNSKSYPC